MLPPLALIVVVSYLYWQHRKDVNRINVVAKQLNIPQGDVI